MSDITIKTDEELALMRTGCRILAEIMEELCAYVKPGITTKDIDALSVQLIKKHNVIPGFKGYHGFPATICTSVNDEVVHVIPNDRMLVEGDILTIDAGVIYKEFNSDMAVTVPVGSISSQAQKLIEVTKQSLHIGIDHALPGNRVGAIGHAVQTFVRSRGFDVVRELVGHGIGRELHEDPPVPNYGPEKSGPVLEPGMTIAIEPMVTVGKPDVLIEGWTVRTKDGSLAAHFEHTIAITENGPEILTQL